MAFTISGTSWLCWATLIVVGCVCAFLEVITRGFWDKVQDSGQHENTTWGDDIDFWEFFMIMVFKCLDAYALNCWKWTEPLSFNVPSMFLTGRGFTRVLRVNWFLVAKSWSMMIPSAPLSSRAHALISWPVFFPTRVTLSMIEGDHLFWMVSPCTGSESNVSSNGFLSVKHDLAIPNIPTDNMAEGWFKNPYELGRRLGEGLWSEDGCLDIWLISGLGVLLGYLHRFLWRLQWHICGCPS